MRIIMLCVLTLVSGVAAAAGRGAAPGEGGVERARALPFEAGERRDTGAAEHAPPFVSCNREVAPFDAEGHLLETRLAIAAEHLGGGSSCTHARSTLRPALSIHVPPACDRDRRADRTAEVLRSASTLLRGAGEVFQLESVSPELVVVSLPSDLKSGRLDALASSLAALDPSTDVTPEEAAGDTGGSSGPSP